MQLRKVRECCWQEAWWDPPGVTGGGGFDPTLSRWEHRGCPQWGSGQPHGIPRVSAVPSALWDGGLGKEVLGAVLLSRAKGSTRLQSPQKIIRF